MRENKFMSHGGGGIYLCLVFQQYSVEGDECLRDLFKAYIT